MLATLFAALILFEPDLGTTIALVLMLAGMLVVAGVPARLLAGAGTIAMVAGLAAIWVEPYRRARFLSFLDPWGDPQNTGFQTVQAIIGDRLRRAHRQRARRGRRRRSSTCPSSRRT